MRRRRSLGILETQKRGKTARDGCRVEHTVSLAQDRLIALSLRPVHVLAVVHPPG